jgi:signal peptidase I
MAETLPVNSKILVENSSSFQRDDIVVFNYYGNNYQAQPDENGQWPQHWEKRVYRLVAMSGDVIELKNGDLFINDRKVPSPPKALMPYEIKATTFLDDLPERDQFPVQIKTRVGDTIVYTAALTTGQVAQFRQRKPAVISVEKEIAAYDYTYIDTMFTRNDENSRWNIDNYGPLRIPSPGEKIMVTRFNYKLYHNIPGIREGEQVLKEKLYFVMGDNRHGAEDSRYIGFIPHSNMIGIVK